MSEDVRRCFAFVTNRDAHGLDVAIHLMQGRCVRLMRVLRCNMEENPARYAGEHETRVLSLVEQLRDKGLCIFFELW